MKKIGKKLSYLTKLFLAIGLLFNNLSSLSIVFADETSGSEVTINEGVSDSTNGDEVGLNSENGENNSSKDDGTQPTDLTNVDGSNDNVPAGDATLGEGADNPSAPSGSGNETTQSDDNTNSETGTEGGDTTTPSDTTEGTTGDDTSVPATLEFTISVNDNNEIVIKYNQASELADDIKLQLVEDIIYLDQTGYGNKETSIDLSDEVKSALASQEGYIIQSEVLSTNSYDGEYQLTATIGENSRNISKKIANEAGLNIQVFNTAGALVEPDSEGIYNFTSSDTGYKVVATLLAGGISPSDTFDYDGSQYSALEMINGVSVDEALSGYLYGKYTQTVSVTNNATGEVLKEEVLTIMYGTYQENTDALNKSVKNVSLDSEYAFLGDSEKGTIYALSSDKIEDIIKDYLGTSELIEYTITGEGDELVVTLTDKHGVTITYEGAKLSSDTTIDARLDNEASEIVSGDEFSIGYIIKVKDYPVDGFTGLVNYDKELFELVDMEVSEFVGNNQDDKFLYIVGEALTGNTTTDEEGNEIVTEAEYVLVTFKFKALKSGTGAISVDDSKFMNSDVYYEASEEVSLEVTVAGASDNTLSSLTVADEEISLEDGVFEYELTVPNDVTEVTVQALPNDSNASITSIVYPEELVEGENTVVVTVMAEDGTEATYTIKVTREAASTEEDTTDNSQEEVIIPVVNYENNYSSNNNNNNNNDKKDTVVPDENKNSDIPDTSSDDGKENNVSRIIIILLILLVIAGLIYLIFKDDGDSEEKQANKDIDKLKKENSSFDTRKSENKANNRPNNNRNNRNNNYNRNNQNNKKGR